MTDLSPSRQPVPPARPANAARIGIGGPVGSGKTALIEALLPVFARRGISVAVVTNDLVTAEDAERLRRSGIIDPARVLAVEAGTVWTLAALGAVSLAALAVISRPLLFASLLPELAEAKGVSI